jgi:hypothetical protein
MLDRRDFLRSAAAAALWVNAPANLYWKTQSVDVSDTLTPFHTVELGRPV